MKLATEKSKKTFTLMRQSYLLYGKPKIGKTTLASKWGEQPYFIATEKGHEAVSIYKSDASTWDEFKKACELLCTQKNNFDTIVIDTITNAWWLCMIDICAKKGWKHPTDGKYGKGYDTVKTEFLSTLIPLTRIDKGLILISHESTKENKFKEEEESFIIPLMAGSLRDCVMPLCGVIARMYMGRAPAGNRMVEQHLLSCKSNSKFEAGDRDNLLGYSESISLEPEEKAFENIKKAWLSALEKKDKGSYNLIDNFVRSSENG